MIFENGNKYDLRNKDLTYFLLNPNMNENKYQRSSINIIRFYKDVKYDLNLPGDKRI